MDAGSIPLIVFDTEGGVLFREQVLLAQLGFAGASGIFAQATPGEVCWYTSSATLSSRSRPALAAIA